MKVSKMPSALFVALVMVSAHLSSASSSETQAQDETDAHFARLKKEAVSRRDAFQKRRLIEREQTGRREAGRQRQIQRRADESRVRTEQLKAFLVDRKSKKRIDNDWVDAQDLRRQTLRDERQDALRQRYVRSRDAYRSFVRRNAVIDEFEEMGLTTIREDLMKSTTPAEQSGDSVDGEFDGSN